MKCQTCGHSYTEVKGAGCPNNNCPEHVVVAPAAEVEVQDANTETCESCGAKYTPTADEKCPNNNCPSRA